MKLDKITTATGKEFDTDYFVTIPTPAMCFLRVLNSDMQTVESVFRDENETSTLTYNGIDYEGYTHFESIAQEDQALKVVLKK